MTTDTQLAQLRAAFTTRTQKAEAYTVRQTELAALIAQKAKGSDDPAQWQAYYVAVDYFNGKANDQRVLVGALWAMGESYAVNWQ